MMSVILLWRIFGQSSSSFLCSEIWSQRRDEKAADSELICIFACRTLLPAGPAGPTNFLLSSESSPLLSLTRAPPWPTPTDHHRTPACAPVDATHGWSQKLANHANQALKGTLGGIPRLKGGCQSLHLSSHAPKFPAWPNPLT
jgi:hypothetical protein